MDLRVIQIETECLVVGGGPAGYGAAMGALALGCQTLLVERHGYLGGMGTAAGLGAFLNHRDKGRDLADTVYLELITRLAEAGGHYHDPIAQADYFNPEICKRVMESTLIDEGGRIIYHALLLSVVQKNEGRWEVDFAAKGARLRVSCRYVIDSTGDADFCALAGGQMTHGRRSDGKTQPMTMVVQMGGFSPAAWKASGGRLIDGCYATDGDCFSADIQRARARGEWSIPRETIALWWATPGDPSRITVNGTRINGYSACDPIGHSDAEREGRRQAAELVGFFRNYIPGFEQAVLTQTGPQIGVRESRRIVGRSTLEESDITANRVTDDAIALCAYPIDIHQPDGNSTQFDAENDNHLYGIPYGCLLPQGLPNVIAAGRCISATHEAAGSFRIMPTCMSLGQAAGTAVALARETGTQLEAILGREVRARMTGAAQPA